MTKKIKIRVCTVERGNIENLLQSGYIVLTNATADDTSPLRKCIYVLSQETSPFARAIEFWATGREGFIPQNNRPCCKCFLVKIDINIARNSLKAFLKAIEAVAESIGQGSVAEFEKLSMAIWDIYSLKEERADSALV